MDFDKKIDELFLDLPEALPESGAVANAVQVGKLIFLSGALPWKEGKIAYKGRLGLEVSIDNGRAAAHAACMQALGTLRNFLGGRLNKVKQVVHLKGYISSGGDFHEQQKVLDGASRLLHDIFGDTAGKHARTAVGVNVLPNNAAIELELVVEVK